jgi:hypothetical protein
MPYKVRYFWHIIESALSECQMLKMYYKRQGLGTERNETKRNETQETHNFLKRNETEYKFQVHETKRNDIPLKRKRNETQ